MTQTTQATRAQVPPAPVDLGRVQRRAGGDLRWARRAQASSGIVVFLILWELIPRLGVVSPDAMTPFTRVVITLLDGAATSEFWTTLLETLRTWSIGMGVSVAAGVALGIIVGLVGPLREATHSTVEFLRPIPSVALIPLAVLIFGTGFQSGVMLIVYAAFWQVLLQVLYGIQDVDPVALDTARVYRFGVGARIRYVVWPTALPYVFTGIRLASSVALVLAITAELVIGTPGIGSVIANARASGNNPTMYAYVLVAGILGVLINVLARAAEKRFMWWHASIRRDAQGGAR